jgi:hypothetical protein
MPHKRGKRKKESAARERFRARLLRILDWNPFYARTMTTEALLKEAKSRRKQSQALTDWVAKRGKT